VVAIIAVLGLATLVTWISLRYVRPVAPDRVAWQWVQQLVKGRPHKAEKYAMLHYGAAWDGASASREASTLFHGWKKTREARYAVRRADWIRDDQALVSVDFTLKGNVGVTEYVLLCKTSTGEWKVCGLHRGLKKKVPKGR
jgi:hypothetical protein